MDREIVVIVPTEAAGYGAMTALRGLDDEGSIELYAATVLTKDADGTVRVKDTKERAPWGTVLGVSTGALIGLLAGPAGAAVGAAFGAAIGLGGDLAYSGFAGDFIRDVSRRLEPGMHAVCASVWEDWTTPIDVAVAPFGAVVFRQATDDVVVAQLRTDMQALREEAAYVEDEIRLARGDARAKLEAERIKLRAKQAVQRERLHERAEALQKRWEAQIASIQQKAATSKAEAQARHKRHLEKLDRFAAMQKQSFQQLFA